MNRRLPLKRETLAALTTDELANVAAAGADAPEALRTVDVLMCLTLHRTCILTTV